MRRARRGRRRRGRRAARRAATARRGGRRGRPARCAGPARPTACRRGHRAAGRRRRAASIAAATSSSEAPTVAPQNATFSATVRSRYSPLRCPSSPTRGRIASRCVARSSPSTRPLPRTIGSSPAHSRSRLVLPAPFGPCRSTISPASTRAWRPPAPGSARSRRPRREHDSGIARECPFPCRVDTLRRRGSAELRRIHASSVSGVTEQLAGHVDGEDAAAEPVAAPDATSRPAASACSKWDRPPEPHDWRFYVGGLGKILITIGLLMFGFVAYQLWGTGIETARAQNKLENQFEQLLAESATSTAAPTTVAPHDVASDATVPASTPTSQPGDHGRRLDRHVAPSWRNVPDRRAGTRRAAHPADRARRGARQARDPQDRQDGRQRAVRRAGRVARGPQEGSWSLPGDAAAGPARQRLDRRPPHDVRRTVPPHRRARSPATRSSSRC